VTRDQDALLAPDAEVEEASGGAVGEVEEVGVGEVRGGGVDGDLGGALGEVALDQVGAHVVAVWEIHHRELLALPGAGRRRRWQGRDWAPGQMCLANITLVMWSW